MFMILKIQKFVKNADIYIIKNAYNKKNVPIVCIMVENNTIVVFIS